MKKQWTRLIALTMTLCMMVSVLPVSAGAAEVASATKAAMQTTVEDAGCDAVGSAVLVDAGAASAAVTKSLTCAKAKSQQTVVVAVQAIDENGAALSGHDVRFVLGTYKNGSVTVTYQETGCRYFAMMPIQCTLEQGYINPLLTTAEKSGSNYIAHCLAELVMSDDLAMTAVVNKSDPAMKDLRFTCYLENDVLAGPHDINPIEVDLVDPENVYTLVKAENTDEGVKIMYRISDEAFARWKTMAAADVKAELQTKMSIQCSETVSADAMESNLNQDGELYTYGRIEITNGETGSKDIPGVDVKRIVVPTKLAVIDIDASIPGIADPEDSGVADILNTKDHMMFMQGDDKGTFRPDSDITRAEVAMIFYRLLKDQDVEITVSFNDVADSAWYAEAVNTLASLGIVNGVGDNTFDPNRAIKRSEFAAICARFAEAATGGAAFTDVPASHWAYSYITTCATYGWITGYEDGTFRPDRAISRAEAATMVNRMLGRLPDKVAIDAGLGRQFPDVTPAHWAWYQIGEATCDHNYTMNADRTQETWN